MFCLLERIDEVGYDEMNSVVVEARDTVEARRVAGTVCGDEGPECWMDSKRVTCRPMLKTRTARVICRDFKAG